MTQKVEYKKGGLQLPLRFYNIFKRLRARRKTAPEIIGGQHGDIIGFASKFNGVTKPCCPLGLLHIPIGGEVSPWPTPKSRQLLEFTTWFDNLYEGATKLHKYKTYSLDEVQRAQAARDQYRRAFLEEFAEKVWG